MIYILHVVGDFHFLWECLKVVMETFWGKPSQPGSLCNLKEIINRKQVEKTAKNFSIADEFIIHAFKSHLVASICNILKIENASCIIPHQLSLCWLKDTYSSVNNCVEIISRPIVWISSIVPSCCFMWI